MTLTKTWTETHSRRSVSECLTTFAHCASAIGGAQWIRLGVYEVHWYGCSPGIVLSFSIFVLPICPPFSFLFSHLLDSLSLSFLSGDCLQVAKFLRDTRWLANVLTHLGSRQSRGNSQDRERGRRTLRRWSGMDFGPDPQVCFVNTSMDMCRSVLQFSEIHNF